MARRVEIWDSGTYQVTEGALDRGKLVFEDVRGEAQGRFSLVQIKGKGKDWLLIKGHDEFADPDWKLETGAARR